MKNFKDIFEKWEQENNFNYEKILKDKDDDSEKLQDFCGLKKKTVAKEVSIDLHGLTRYDAIAKLDSLLYKYKNNPEIFYTISGLLTIFLLDCNSSSVQ